MKITHYFKSTENQLTSLSDVKENIKTENDCVYNEMEIIAEQNGVSKSFGRNFKIIWYLKNFNVCFNF